MSIGSHSVDHKCLPANAVCTHSNGGTPLTFAQAVAEITGGHRAVYETLGWVDPFFRFPYGEYSPELKQFLSDHGTAEFFWTIDSEDWKNQTPQQMVDNTFHQLDALGRGIILFHDIQRKTAETLPLILSELYFKGYSVVGIRSSNPNDRRNSKLLQVNAASVATASPAGKTLK
jgi:peptidoglycan/xylan/chitin deacetylase (PgdA/CDA1 family)